VGRVALKKNWVVNCSDSFRVPGCSLFLLVPGNGSAFRVPNCDYRLFVIRASQVVRSQARTAAFSIRSVARRNSAVLPGPKPNCQFEIREARARNPNIFFSALAVETLLPASGNRSNYSHDFFVDTPGSSRYIAHLRCATIFVLADPYLGSIHRSSPIHCSQSLSIYRPPIISSGFDFAHSPPCDHKVPGLAFRPRRAAVP
jgi:hypothetical protein